MLLSTFSLRSVAWSCHFTSFCSPPRIDCPCAERELCVLNNFFSGFWHRALYEGQPLCFMILQGVRRWLEGSNSFLLLVPFESHLHDLMSICHSVTCAVYEYSCVWGIIWNIKLPFLTFCRNILWPDTFFLRIVVLQKRKLMLLHWITKLV